MLLYVSSNSFRYTLISLLFLYGFDTNNTVFISQIVLIFVKQKQSMKKEYKEFLSNMSVPTDNLHMWINQAQKTFSVYVNQIFSNKFGMDNEYAIDHSYGEITIDEINEAILVIICKNFRLILWNLYFKNKTLNIKHYINPYHSEYSKWGARLRYNTIEEFNELLNIFCVKYTITNKINSHDLPTVDITLEFDLKKASQNIKNLIIPIK